MKIKLSEVNQMIKEEFQKMLEKKKLSTRLSAINEELSKMNEEDASLNEVEAAGETTVASHAWTGKEDGDVKFKPKFEKIGSHLKEDDIEGVEGSETITEPGVAGEPGAEVKEMGEFEAKFAEIGRAIDAKMSAEMGGAGATVPAGTGEPDADDFEEVSVEGPASEGGEGADDSGKPEVDEDVAPSQHLNPEVAIKSTEEDSHLKGEVQESVDEPIEGHSVAQEVGADKVNDNMEKDTHVKEGEKKEGEVITEGTKPAAKNIFTEGVDDKKKAAMLKEMNRMKKFAGLSKDEE